MIVRRAWLGWSALTVVLALLVVVAGRFVGGGVSIVSVGSPAPDFAAKTLDQVPRVKTLADYRGRVVLLNLWATYCGPCEVEMPSIERLYHDYAPAGLQVVAISIDDPGFEDKVRDFTARHGLTFEILNEGSGKIETDYQARGIPSTYLIGPDGRIRKRVTGASDWSSAANRALVAQLLAAPRNRE